MTFPLARLAGQTFVVQFSPDQTMRTLNFKENSNRKSNSSISLIPTFQCSTIGDRKKRESEQKTGRDFARNGKKHVTKSLVICPNKKSGPEIKRQEMKNLTNNFFWGLMLSLYLWRVATDVKTLGDL